MAITETELERLVVRLVGDAASYRKMLSDVTTETAHAGREIKKQSEQVEVFGKTIGNLGTQMSTVAASFSAMAVLGRPLDWVKSGVMLAAEAEQMEVSFGTMLKSAEAGKELVEKIQDLAAKTPMSQAGLQSAAKLLLQFGTAGGEIIPTLTMLGDVVGGDQEKLMSMALAFGQMKSTGHLMGQDLLQMINAGFNPLEEIARKTGKTMAQLRQDMEKGKVTFADVKDAFRSASSAGGQFANQMDKQSKTLKGLWSTLRDDIDAALRTVGKDIMEKFHLKELIARASEFAQNFVTWWGQISEATKKTLVDVVLFGAGFLAITKTWMIGNKVIGMVVGNLASMIDTVEWLARGLVSIISPLNILKTAFGFFTSVGGMLLSLLNPLTLISTLISGIGAVVAAVFSPVTLAIAGVVIGLSVLADQLGGWDQLWEAVKQFGMDAWEGIKEAGQDFMKWAQPIWDAIVSFSDTAWTTIKGHALDAYQWVSRQLTALKDWALEVWDSITGGARINWGRIREYIQNAILFGEFTIKNFGKVASFVWSWVKLGFVRFVEYVVYFFTVLAPAYIEYFGENWRAILTDVWNFTKAVFVNLAHNIKELANNIGSLLTGKKSISDIWRPLDEGYRRTRPEFHVPERVKSELEKAIEEEYNLRKADLAESFDEFRRKKLDEFALKHQDVIPENTVAEVKRSALQMGNDIAGGLGVATKEAKKLDAALFGSAESKARIEAFRSTLREEGINITPTYRGEALDRRRVPLLNPNTPYDVAQNPAVTNQRTDPVFLSMLQVLIQIYNINAVAAKKPPIVLPAAGLAGP